MGPTARHQSSSLGGAEPPGVRDSPRSTGTIIISRHDPLRRSESWVTPLHSIWSSAAKGDDYINVFATGCSQSSNRHRNLSRRFNRPNSFLFIHQDVDVGLLRCNAVWTCRYGRYHPEVQHRQLHRRKILKSHTYQGVPERRAELNIWIKERGYNGCKKYILGSFIVLRFTKYCLGHQMKENGYVRGIGEMSNAYKILVEKREGRYH
jgi:hypothetical protein